MLARDSLMSESPSKEYDFLFKVVMVGDPGVGKSCILLRFADDLFNDNYYATIGVDFRFKTLALNNKYVKLQIWDTAGQEKFRCLTNAYYKGADCVLLVFDLSSKASFDNLEEWMTQITQYVDTSPLVVLLGAKSDLTSYQAVSNQEIEDFVKRNKLIYFPVSAKANINILETFVHLVQNLMDKMPEVRKKKTVLNIADPHKLEKKNLLDGCCRT